MGNGGPAPEGVTNKIFENTKTIKEYFIAEGLPDVMLNPQTLEKIKNLCYMQHLDHIADLCIQVDISAIGISNFSGPDGQFDVDVFDSASDYVKLMKYDTTIDLYFSCHIITSTK